jgi:hypothetical protein
MRVMMIVKANRESEAGILPSDAALQAMGRYNEELVRAGIMLDGAGLKPSSAGARVDLRSGQAPRVIDGPFAETKELIAGYWIIQVKTFEEAVEWAKRIPHGPDVGGDGTIELRPLFEMDDFGEGPGVDLHKEIASELGRQRV